MTEIGRRNFSDQYIKILDDTLPSLKSRPNNSSVQMTLATPTRPCFALQFNHGRERVSQFDGINIKFNTFLEAQLQASFRAYFVVVSRACLTNPVQSDHIQRSLCFIWVLSSYHRLKLYTRTCIMYITGHSS